MRKEERFLCEGSRSCMRIYGTEEEALSCEREHRERATTDWFNRQMEALEPETWFLSMAEDRGPAERFVSEFRELIARFRAEYDRGS